MSKNHKKEYYENKLISLLDFGAEIKYFPELKDNLVFAVNKVFSEYAGKEDVEINWISKKFGWNYWGKNDFQLDFRLNKVHPKDIDRAIDAFNNKYGLVENPKDFRELSKKYSVSSQILGHSAKYAEYLLESKRIDILNYAIMRDSKQ